MAKPRTYPFNEEIVMWVRDLDGDNLWVKVTSWFDLTYEVCIYNAKKDKKKLIKQLIQIVADKEGVFDDQYEITMQDPYKPTPGPKNEGIPGERRLLAYKELEHLYL